LLVFWCRHTVLIPILNYLYCQCKM
jgi:hypothetical protein